MNYYPFHLGDYARDTRHLSMVEHGAYRLLIDLYYVREAPLPVDDAALLRLVCARSEEEKQAVSTVLSEFFVRTDDGWRHTRCDEEIARGQEKQTKAKAAADARWNADAMRTHSGRNANAMPSQEPKAKSQKPIAKSQTEREANAADAAKLSRGSSIPAEFPSEPEIAWCEQERPDLSAGTVAVAFRDYHLAHGSRMKSWPAAWRTWVRRERLAQPRASPAVPYKTASDKRNEALFRITGGLAGKAPDDGVIDVEPFGIKQIAGR